MRSTKCALAILLLIGSLVACARFSEPSGCRDCNVILISIDTLRGDALGVYGSQPTPSPRIDRFAEAGVVFTNAYAQAPWTIPSHFSILTGTYPTTHGVLYRKNPFKIRPTMASLLKGQGYKTAAFVGGGNLDPKFGFDHGFDLYQSEWVNYAPEKFSARDDFLEKAIAWIERHKREKFFLFLHTYQVHDYANVDESTFVDQALQDEYEPAYKEPADLHALIEKYRSEELSEEMGPLVSWMGQKYRSAILQLDRRMGSFFDYLGAQGLLRDTIVIITTDHGEEFGEHSHLGHGSTLYQEQLKIPLIVVLPKRLSAPGIVDNAVASIDIFPTVADYLGIEQEVSEGLSFKSLIEARVSDQPVPELFSSGRRVIYSEVNEWARKFAVLHDGTKLIYGPEDGGKVHANPVEWELYNLAVDPREQTNLFDPGEGKSGMESRKRALITRADAGSLLFVQRRAQPMSEQVKNELRALGYLD